MYSAAASSAASVLADEALLEESVREVLGAIPTTTLRRGADGAGPGHIQRLLNFTPNLKSSNPNSKAERASIENERAELRDLHLDGVWSPEPPATTTRIEHDLYEKVGLMRRETVDPGAMVALVQALNKVPLNAGPNIIRAVLFCALPLLLSGFAQLPVPQRAAFVCIMAPGIAGLLSMRDAVEAMETVSMKEDMDCVTHMCTLMDEGKCICSARLPQADQPDPATTGLTPHDRPDTHNLLQQASE